MTAPATQMPMTEAEWQSRVLDYALLHGWLCHHTRPARTAGGWRTPVQGHAGFFDLILARRGRVLFIELKTELGRLTHMQMQWIACLRDDNSNFIRVWRPSDWDEVQKVLL